VQQLSGGAIDLHMAEGITSMVLQQGGLGVILSVLIVTVPQMTAQFFMGALGSFMHYSNFGGTGGGNTQPGPQGQPAGSYQGPVLTQRQRLGDLSGPNSHPTVTGAATGLPRNPAPINQDVVKTNTGARQGTDY
jgi:type IV secretion system protein VirB6